MSSATPTPSWRPGDIANGYVLGVDNVWHPVAAPPPPAPAPVHSVNTPERIPGPFPTQRMSDLSGPNRALVYVGAFVILAFVAFVLLAVL